MRKLFILFVLFSLVFASCSGVMGYSVLLWNVPEHELEGGDIVPVYIKSNISHVYVIGTKNEKEKAEVPLWQLTEPESRRKAVKTAEKFKEFAHTYASVALDGLPMRSEAVNTSKQVYRLRKNESIKVLYKGKGQAVMSGNTPLEGDWLRVLTSDGTGGWCFSYNLRLYDVDKHGNRKGSEEVLNDDENVDDLESVLSEIWYPDSYKSMIDSGRIDIEKLNPSYMFHLDSDSKKLYFNMPKINKSWDFKGSALISDGQYKLTDIPIAVSVRREDFVVVRYTGENGKPEDFNFVTITQDLDELVQAEVDRRKVIYEKLYELGPYFKSSSYGSLEFKADNSFVWNGNRLLVPSILPSVKNKGNVRIKYFLSRTLSASYDGIITFVFDGIAKEVNFLYKIEENGLRFEDASGAVIKNNILTERSMSPLVIFFSKD